MFKIILATLVLTAYNPTALEGRDFYNVGDDVIRTTYTTMGPPTDYAYIGIYSEPDYSNFDDINIIKVPYQLSIDYSRLEDLQLQIDTQIFYMTPLFSPTYEYHYFSIYAPVVPSGYYKEPFLYFANSNASTFHIRIPTTHSSAMATQGLEHIVLMNKLAYAEELEQGYYELGYSDGELDGYDNGYDYGYTVGINDGVNSNISYSWLRGLFVGLGDLLAIRLFGDITIGSIALIMLSLTLLPFIIGLAKGRD